MSDLSRLLDDVYGTSDEPASTPRATETVGAVPDWFSDAAPEADADHFSVVPDPVEALEAILDLGVAEHGSEVAGRPEPALVVAPDPTPVVALPPTWTPRDDDILPARSTRRRLRRRRR